MTQPAPTVSRLVLVDLMRALAAYGVVVMHTGFPPSLDVSQTTKEFQQFFIFAVPFFLAAAFYFTKLPPSWPEAAQSFRQRTVRLMLPYAFWTLIYLGARLAKYAASNNFQKIQETFCSDPLGLIFMGSAAVHLYFLPLLLIGSALMLFLSPLLRKASPLLLAIALSGAIGLNMLLYPQLFTVGFSSAPLPWSEGFAAGGAASGMRLFSFAATCLVRCLPYICFAILLRYLLKGILPKPFQYLLAAFAGIAFFFVTFYPIQGLPGSVWEIIMGYGPLFIALVLSPLFSGNVWITKLGELSFGIYLCHHLVMEALQMAAGKVLPVAAQGSLPYFSSLTLAGFAISAAMMLGVSRLGQWPRQLCGLR